MDSVLLDLLIKARSLVWPTEAPSMQEPVAVIALDWQSLEDPALAPYPRILLAPMWATVLESVFAAGARAVGFDLLFAYSANRFSANFDRPFLEALGKYRDRVVLGRSAATLPAPPFLAALRNDAGGLGLLELTAERDGRYRRLRATYTTASGETLPGLAQALLRRAQAPTMPETLVLAPRRHVEQLPTYAISAVLRCGQQAPEVLQQVFAEKIVLIGSTIPEEDRRWSSGWLLTPQPADGPLLHACGLRRLGASVPEASSVPGVFLHAAGIEAVVSGRVTGIVPPLIVIALAAIMASGGAALGLVWPPWRAVTVVLGVVALLGAVATELLVSDLWLPLALPLLMLWATPVVAYVIRYLVEERRRHLIEQAFCRYLSPTLVAQLASQPGVLRLGGTACEVTVMFADLSGFTALSERVKPEELVHLTNQYLGYIVEQVEATGGYVDKFIGDAVMAIWGAPVSDLMHALQGVCAALQAVERIHKAQVDAAAQKERCFGVKISLNSGIAVVGNVGTEQRYNYTAVGEVVNVAARLESVPALYACQVVVGPYTAKLVQATVLLCELDTVQVQGKEAPVSIFEPLAKHGDAATSQRMYVEHFAQALAHYRVWRFAEAATLWETAHLQREEFLGNATNRKLTASPASVMAERARAYAKKPPDHTWNGVWVLSHK
jgi:adenylate cyclase